MQGEGWDAANDAADNRPAVTGPAGSDPGLTGPPQNEAALAAGSDTGLSQNDQALTAAGTGAATGAAGGPWGALIGAGAGIFTTLLKEKSMRDREQRARQEARLVAARVARERALTQGIGVQRAAQQSEQAAINSMLAAFRSALV